MKKATLVAMSLTALIAFSANQTLAQDAKDKKPAKEEGSGGHSHFTKIPATVEEIWKKIHEQQAELAAVVAAKDLGEAHDHAFAVRDLVKALPKKVAAEHKARTDASAREIARLATAIDKSGAAGAQKATEANVKKLEVAVAALEAKLKSVDVKK